MFVPDIWDILEDAGYDCDTISDERWDELQQSWEEECECLLDDAIESVKEDVVFAWADQLKLKKKIDASKVS